MVHKADIIPGLSRFIDVHILSQYPPTSLKRIAAAGAIALYLKRNTSIVDVIINNPIISGLGIANPEGMVDIEILRDVYKNEINKAGYLRINFPMLGDIDFTPEDVDALYKCIMEISPPPPSSTNSTIQHPLHYGGIG
jgi:hypothetical protein